MEKIRWKNSIKMWKQLQVFLYLGDRIYSVGGCEAATTSRTRL